MLWEQLRLRALDSRNEAVQYLGEVLRTERLKVGLTQVHLGELIGVDAVSVRRWELGLRLPSVQRLLDLEIVLAKESLTRENHRAELSPLIAGRI